MKYLIKGKFKVSGVFQKFTKTISAKTKRHAIEKLYSIIGSNYKCKRNLIKIESIEELR